MWEIWLQVWNRCSIFFMLLLPDTYDPLFRVGYLPTWSCCLLYCIVKSEAKVCGLSKSNTEAGLVLTYKSNSQESLLRQLISHYCIQNNTKRYLWTEIYSHLTIPIFSVHILDLYSVLCTSSVPYSFFLLYIHFSEINQDRNTIPSGVSHSHSLPLISLLPWQDLASILFFFT